MRLSLTFGDPDWREVMWAEIFDRAKKRSKVIDARVWFHNFQYALLNPEEGYGRDRISSSGEDYQYTGKIITFWIKDAEKDSKVGFNENGLAFVLERLLPRMDFANYIGLHENAEIIYQKMSKSKNDREIHRIGCKMELEEIFKRDSKFIDVYASWLVKLTKESKAERGYFRAIPNFEQVVREGKLTPIEILKEYKRRLDLERNFSV